ncbi:uncharacterized protein LOC131848490 [Achroia grisella]|uniref:uncharacterized protein LOC131848490 n=1 Tax=Achroia grisella TaxID=688607 RepID=UPI0027D25E36|nr:uncharacterized protein LOC131848490 [Achroia grisella]XP_059054355.1 uncharacterized protein LOC131848490 [Achroia grisella]
MKQYKINVGALIVGSIFITLFPYYWYQYSLDKPRTPRARLKTINSTPAQYTVNLPMHHVPLDEIYQDQTENYSFELDNKRADMIDTPGCQIPVSMINYKEENSSAKPGSCGKRAVFLKKIGTDKVHISITANVMKKYLRKKNGNFHCCYRFISRSTQPGHEHTNIKYTNCQQFEDGATVLLETDFINIRCFEHNKQNTTHVIYNDVYGFIKKIDVTKPPETGCNEKYNVLMIGMDSMSLPHIVFTMPRTVNFLKENYWPGFRGFNKVGDNTFPNLMAAFTGKNISTISTICSGKMDECNNLLIWSTFKEAGYVTAYGEDFIKLPDTFSKDYVFKKQPTNHYMRPLFLSGETEPGGQTVCAGKESSGQQILNYALDFTTTYKNDSFFGMFWINSYSHNPNSRSKNADKMFENFLNQLTYTGVLMNTFIIFFSDHGIRFGNHRLKVESHYDERLPFLFIWTPTKFRGKHPELHKAIAINQFRLVTPYDLYNSLIDINRMSTCNNTNKDISEGCPNCQSLFNVVSANRTCQDAAIHAKWCSCHKLYPLDIQDSAGVKSVLHVVSHIQSVIKTIEPKRCWGCKSLSLQKIHRIHFYYDNNKVNLYFVVAFLMSPGSSSYEATVMAKGNEFEIIGPISFISTYNGLGKCALKARDRLFCVCNKIC